VRRLLLAALVVLALLVVADRVGVTVTERVLADELQRSGGLGARPEVDIKGVPFLTQALDGRYERIDVVARDVDAGEVDGTPVQVSRLSATLRGARVPAADALSGAVTSVPVDEVDSRVLLPFSVLQPRTDVGDLTVAPDGDRLRLRGSVEVLGRQVSASARSRLSVDDGAVVVTTESVDLGNDVVSRLATRAVEGRFDVRVELGALPYGLQIQTADVRPDGLSVAARATDTVLSAVTAPGPS
jgi:hypothetical protein